MYSGSCIPYHRDTQKLLGSGNAGFQQAPHDHCVKALSFASYSGLGMGWRDNIRLITARYGSDRHIRQVDLNNFYAIVSDFGKQLFVKRSPILESLVYGQDLIDPDFGSHVSSPDSEYSNGGILPGRTGVWQRLVTQINP
jgi:hypothetical protein